MLKEKELAGRGWDEKVSMMALTVLEAKARSLSPADRADLLEVIREFMTTDDEESRESAASTILEILEPNRGTVRRVSLGEGTATKTPWTASISKKIRELRIAAKLTQEELAARSGLTQSHICRLERGEHSPNGLTLEKLAQGLGVPLARLDPSVSDPAS